MKLMWVQQIYQYLWEGVVRDIIKDKSQIRMHIFQSYDFRKQIKIIKIAKFCIPLKELEIFRKNLFPSNSRRVFFQLNSIFPSIFGESKNTLNLELAFKEFLESKYPPNEKLFTNPKLRQYFQVKYSQNRWFFSGSKVR